MANNTYFRINIYLQKNYIKHYMKKAGLRPESF